MSLIDYSRLQPGECQFGGGGGARVKLPTSRCSTMIVLLVQIQGVLIAKYFRRFNRQATYKQCLLECLHSLSSEGILERLVNTFPKLRKLKRKTPLQATTSRCCRSQNRRIILQKKKIILQRITHLMKVGSVNIYVGFLAIRYDHFLNCHSSLKMRINFDRLLLYFSINYIVTLSYLIKTNENGNINKKYVQKCVGN